MASDARRARFGVLIVPAAVVLALLTAGKPAPIEVVDGDTVRVGGRLVRLVGFDAPESGPRARCDDERRLADRATARLGALVAAGGVELRPVACSCRPGTEGTTACNHGRLCGDLLAHGESVGAVLIREGLARPYHCGARSCSPRLPWC